VYDDKHTRRRIVKNKWSLVAALLMLSINTAQSQSTTDFRDLSGGWKAMTRQADPFDKTKIQIIQIFKGDFTFRCQEINMRVNSTGIDALSFDAELKYIVDDKDAVDKSGKYSTYLGGSNIVTRMKFYSAKISNSEVDAIKKGQNIKMAGKFGSSGWSTRELALDGFAEAYEAMCK
jgi:hypothetical protein